MIALSSPELPTLTCGSTMPDWLERVEKALYRVLNVRQGEMQRKMPSEMVAGKASGLCQPLSRG